MTSLLFILALDVICTPDFSIHGLWVDPVSYCQNISFDYGALAPILPRLQQDWRSCYETNAEFWAHEWEKHGTCFNMTQLDYFSRGLDLFYQYRNNCSSGSVDCNICFDVNFTHIPCTSLIIGFS